MEAAVARVRASRRVSVFGLSVSSLKLAASDCIVVVRPEPTLALSGQDTLESLSTRLLGLAGLQRLLQTLRRT